MSLYMLTKRNTPIVIPSGKCFPHTCEHAVSQIIFSHCANQVLVSICHGSLLATQQLNGGRKQNDSIIWKRKEAVMDHATFCRGGIACLSLRQSGEASCLQPLQEQGRFEGRLFQGSHHKQGRRPTPATEQTEKEAELLLSSGPL